jgi:hypothetical protein
MLGWDNSSARQKSELPRKVHEVLINLQSLEVHTSTLNCNRIKLLDILSLMFKTGRNCMIVNFSATHISEEVGIRQEEVLVVVRM